MLASSVPRVEVVEVVEATGVIGPLAVVVEVVAAEVAVPMQAAMSVLWMLMTKQHSLP